MHVNKKALITVMFAGSVTAGVGALNMTPKKDRNLKVLPKDISDARLDSIMQTYNKALGVTCNFCHVELKTFPGGLDYASDANPMKENGRDMMRMTIDINKNNFYFNKAQQPEYLTTVTCNTCHRGEPFPEH